MKKLTTEEFIEKVKNIYGDKYDYSKVEYIGSHNKVCIICKEHGEFLQRPNCHLNGRGCPKCGILSQIKIQTLTIIEFVEKAKIVHDDKYDYSKVEYKGNKTKVCIICPEHGEFWQRPDDHLNGKGCSKCSDLKRGCTLRCTKREFIKKSIKIHSNKYDYSKTEYANNKTKICIICPEHGEFWQIPSDHLNGCGCPICNESKLEKEIAKLLDENNITYERQKHFKWLGKQSLDFYLIEYKIAIECQGGQHFKPVEHFGGEDGLLKCIERDERKYKLCTEHGINILYYTNVTIPEDYENYVYIDKEELLTKIKG